MNRQYLTKFCILIITDKIYVGIVMHHQFFKNSYSPLDNAIARKKSDPLKILVSNLISIIAGNKKKYIVSNEFEIGPDPTTDCEVSFL